MQISFRTQYRDLIAFNVNHWLRSSLFVGVLVFILVMGIKPNWEQVMKVAADRSLLIKIPLFVFLELLPIVLAFIIMALFILATNFSKMKKAALSESTITLGDDRIITESASSRSVVLWTVVQKLVHTHSHIFLYVKNQGTIVIPRRAFNSDEAWDQFLAACQAKLKEFHPEINP